LFFFYSFFVYIIIISSSNLLKQLISWISNHWLIWFYSIFCRYISAKYPEGCEHMMNDFFVWNILYSIGRGFVPLWWWVILWFVSYPRNLLFVVVASVLLNYYSFFCKLIYKYLISRVISLLYWFMCTFVISSGIPMEILCYIYLVIFACLQFVFEEFVYLEGRCMFVFDYRPY